jgi:alpha-amylase
LLATLTRRPEAYHKKVVGGANNGHGNVASIHERVVFKQAGLEQRLQYDKTPRKSLLDHFYDAGVSLDQVSRNEASERGDFLNGIYDTKIRRGADRVQVQLSRTGTVQGREIKITKGVTMLSRNSTMEIVYLLENLPPNDAVHFAVELNFSGLPSGADDRYFHDLDGKRLGQLGSRLDLAGVQKLGLVDEWLGIDVQLTASRPTDLWAFPIETVSQSEGGFELVHQSVCVQPHWLVQGDPQGRWSVTLHLNAKTALAESRMQPKETLAAV